MKKKVRRLVALGLAAASMCSTVACGNNGSTAESEAPKIEATDDIWAAYDEEVTLTTVQYQGREPVGV